MLLGSGCALGVLEFLIGAILILYAYFRWRYNYWKRHHLPQLEPTIPFGNLPTPFGQKISVGIHFGNLYRQIKQRGLKHAGIYFFSAPDYYVVDLDYIKNILTKNFEYFTDRGAYYNEKVDPLSAHLFAIGGEKWHNLRMKLTPTFTSGKMKQMFQTLLDCEQGLHRLAQKYFENNEAIDIKELTSRFTIDVIGSVAFGLECHSFEAENSPFRIYGKKTFYVSPWRRFVLIFMNSFPKLAELLELRVIPKDCADFFLKVVEDTVRYREDNGVIRNDFLQLLIELKNTQPHNEQRTHDDGKSLTLNEVAAQSFLFFIAGYDTSSTAMTFIFYELARNQAYQQKVREEISRVLTKYDGKITYEALGEMKYMTQVIEETLRLYPPAPFVTREAVKDYKIPDCDDNVIIKKGTRVIIPIYGIHHDPEYYPDPERFDPERFCERNKQNRQHPYMFIPFGEGPRHCIGFRFAMMQIKVGLISLLKHYKFTVNKKTQEPLTMDVGSFFPKAVGDIWLDVEKV